MKKRLLVLIFASANFLLLPIQSEASHIMGGNITYSCIGQDSFLIQLSLYRDCTGITLSSTQTVSFSAPGCPTVTASLSLLPGSGNDITPLCPGWPSPCISPTPQLPLGVEEYIYEGIVVLSGGSGCNYTMSWTQCCRNDDITTIDNPSSAYFYIYTDMNRSVRSCNQSPVFTNPPVPFVCAGNQVSYNHGVIDTVDNDSLVFSLVQCRETSKTAFVSYLPAYSATQPLLTTGPVTIDPQTGTISFIPSVQQVGIICVLVEEYDRATGQKIGELIRDIQIVVLPNCQNAPPEASGIDGGADYDTAVCPGQGLSFDIFSSDPTPFQSVTMTWNKGISGATFNISPGQYPTGTFTWNPTLNDVGFHFFTVTVMDDGCPVTAQQTFAYSIEVRNPNIDLGPDLTVCDGDTVQGSVPIETVDFTQYTWSPTSGIIPPVNVKRPQFSPDTSTAYVLVASNGFCQAIDTLRVNVDSRPTINTSGNQVICEGDSIELTASGDAASYEWTPGGTGSSIIVSPGSTTSYIVEGTSAFGCRSDTSLTVTVSPLPTVDAGPDATICIGEEHTLAATGTGSQFSWEPANLVEDPTEAVTTTQASSTTTFTVTNTDNNGCSSTDTVLLEVAQGLMISAHPDTSINLGDIVTLSSGNPNASTYLWSPDVGLEPGSSLTDAEIQVSPGETTTYTVEITDASGCRTIDSVTVTLVPGKVALPNAFTPNGDGLNDELYLLGGGLIQIETFKVYNRWGQLVFEGNQAGKDNGWDGTFNGKEQPAGVYTYMYIEIDPDTGEPRDPVSGNVTLIR